MISSSNQDRGDLGIHRCLLLPVCVHNEMFSASRLKRKGLGPERWNFNCSDNYRIDVLWRVSPCDGFVMPEKPEVLPFAARSTLLRVPCLLCVR